MTVKFSGENGKYFYSLVKKGVFLIYLVQILVDLICITFENPNPLLPESFMVAKSKRKKAVWKGMRIGNRPNSNYYRVYQKTKKIDCHVYSEMNKGLKFKLELKNQLVQSFQEFLFHNRLKEFESKLVEHFLKYSKKYFVLDSCYTDWLRISLRKIFSNQKSKTSKQFFKLIQLLSFLRTLGYSRQFLDSCRIRCYGFYRLYRW